MVRFKMIDTETTGIRRVFNIQRERFFPLPDFDLSQKNKVDVTLYGREIDEKFTYLLHNNEDLDLVTVYLLDQVQKGNKIPKEALSAYPKEKLLDRSCVDEIRQSSEEMKLNIWYPPKTDIECVTAYGSFLPVFLYYHKRLAEWSLYFRTCKVCNKIFLAKSLKYTICSDKCRKKQNTQAKRDFDARALENEYDHIYKNEAQRWLHYIHRMEMTANCSPEQLSAIKSAYEVFKKEATMTIT